MGQTVYRPLLIILSAQSDITQPAPSSPVIDLTLVETDSDEEEDEVKQRGNKAIKLERDAEVGIFMMNFSDSVSEERFRWCTLEIVFIAFLLIHHP